MTEILKEEVVEEDNDEDIGDLVKAEELLEDLEEDDGDDGGEIVPEFVGTTWSDLISIK